MWALIVHWSSPSVLLAALGGGSWGFPHFTEEQTGSERPSCLCKITQQQVAKPGFSRGLDDALACALTTAAYLSVTSISRRRSRFLSTYCVPAPLTH